jgi:hypothetical protein
MNPNDALALLSEKLTEHGLVSKGWQGELDNAERRFGVCRPSQKTISLSRILVAKNSDEEVRDTILHEIAHALAAIETGENCGHDHRWQAICRRIGARPERCYDSAEVTAPEAPWVLAHRETGEIFTHCQKRPNSNLREVFIRGRKKETLGQLEIRANPAFAAKPLEYFDQPTTLNLQQRILDTLQPLVDELDIEITPNGTRFNASQINLGLEISLAPRDGLTAEEREFQELAPVFGLTVSDYRRPLVFNRIHYSLIGFKPRNRKYPVIVEAAGGARYKLPLDALDHLS